MAVQYTLVIVVPSSSQSLLICMNTEHSLIQEYFLDLLVTSCVGVSYNQDKGCHSISGAADALGSRY